MQESYFCSSVIAPEVSWLEGKPGASVASSVVTNLSFQSSKEASQKRKARPKDEKEGLRLGLFI